MTDYLQQLRSFRLTDEPIKRGSPTRPNRSQNTPVINDLATGLGTCVITTIAVFILLLFLKHYFRLGIFELFGRALLFGLIAAWLYFIWPAFAVVGYIFKNLTWPDKSFIDKFGPLQKFGVVLTLAFGLTYTGNFIYLSVAHVKSSNSWLFLLFWIICTIAIASLLDQIWRNPPVEQSDQDPEPELTKQELKALPFRLWLGVSTGKLAQAYHGAGIATDQDISLNLQDAAQNILVLGGIGGGKTTSAVHPLLIQLLDQNCGGLIFDIKGDFQKAVLHFAEQTGREITTIGPDHHKINLLAGLSPEMAASFLKSVFTLNSQNRLDSFWIDTATELCRNTLGILSFVPSHYSLSGLYSYIFDLEGRLTIDEELKTRLIAFNEVEKRLLNSYWQYYERIFDKFEEKAKAGVNATIAQILAPFNHPALIDTFCTEGENNVAMEDVLNGAVYLVEMPLATWGLGGKVVYTLIKLRFFNVMQQRIAHPTWNQEKPVFFMCDEFQEIVSANRDGISDLNFWDKSRSSKTIGIISAQAVSSFYAAIGDRDTANALLQNFRQKICFRTEDTTTLNYFYDLADKVEVARTTESWTSGESQQDGFGGKKTNSSSHTSNTTFVDKPVLDAQLFRSLDKNQAIALLSIDGKSMDDVVNTLAVYV